MFLIVAKFIQAMIKKNREVKFNKNLPQNF